MNGMNGMNGMYGHGRNGNNGRYGCWRALAPGELLRAGDDVWWGGEWIPVRMRAWTNISPTATVTRGMRYRREVLEVEDDD